MYLRYMTAHVRVNTSITCYAGYFAVHLLRKYTTMLGFLPLASSKIPLLRSAAASLLLIFSLYARVKPSITCYAGYFAVHLLRKYTTMLGFLPRYKKAF